MKKISTIFLYLLTSFCSYAHAEAVITNYTFDTVNDTQLFKTEFIHDSGFIDEANLYIPEAFITQSIVAPSNATSIKTLTFIDYSYGNYYQTYLDFNGKNYSSTLGTENGSPSILWDSWTAKTFQIDTPVLAGSILNFDFRSSSWLSTGVFGQIPTIPSSFSDGAYMHVYIPNELPCAECQVFNVGSPENGHVNSILFRATFETSNISPVPELPVSAMLLIGMVLLGFGVKRKQ